MPEQYDLTSKYRDLAGKLLGREPKHAPLGMPRWNWSPDGPPFSRDPENPGGLCNADDRLLAKKCQISLGDWAKQGEQERIALMEEALEQPQGSSKPLDPAELVSKADLDAVVVPELSKPNNKSWIKATELAEKIRPSAESLKQYRSPSKGGVLIDDKAGRDCHGRFWRKDKNGHVWYLKKSLTNDDKKLLKING